jgi:hypothetical protein
MERSAALVTLPEAFVRFQSLVQIHLHRILEIPKKQPIHAVALLVVVACEGLSQLLGEKRAEDFFADRYLSRRGVPPNIGRDLFQALRHGLAHIYSPFPIVVGDLEVQPTMSWKDGASAHLQVFGGRVDEEGHLHFVPIQKGERPARLCLNVESMVNDLNDLFAEVEAQLREDADLRARVERRATEMRDEGSKKPQGTAADAWREFLRGRGLPGDEV